MDSVLLENPDEEDESGGLSGIVLSPETVFFIFLLLWLTAGMMYRTIPFYETFTGQKIFFPRSREIFLKISSIIFFLYHEREKSISHVFSCILNDACGNNLIPLLLKYFRQTYWSGGISGVFGVKYFNIFDR